MKKMQRIIFFFLLPEDKQQFKFGVVMIGLTLFLACFSIIFSRYFIQNRGVLEQLFMISGYL